MHQYPTILITGANAGIGRECAKQLAAQPHVERIILGCRNPTKAEAAKAALEAETGRAIFDVLILDMMDAASVRAAVERLDAPVDAVVLNAGGMGGKTPHAKTADGVTHIFAVNIHGHAVLLDALLERQLLRGAVLYAGSEAARGIPKMGVPRPMFGAASEDEFLALARGHTYDDSVDPMLEYGAIKLTAAMWMSALARAHPHIRFITMSPGGTTGTNGMDDLPLLKKVMFKYVGGLLMPLFGMMHSVEKGAQRYVSGLQDPAHVSGHFYASKRGAPTGPVVDQASLFSDLSTRAAEANAQHAIDRLL